MSRRSVLHIRSTQMSPDTPLITIHSSSNVRTCFKVSERVHSVRWNKRRRQAEKVSMFLHTGGYKRYCGILRLARQPLSNRIHSVDLLQPFPQSHSNQTGSKLMILVKDLRTTQFRTSDPNDTCFSKPIEAVGSIFNGNREKERDMKAGFFVTYILRCMKLP